MSDCDRILAALRDGPKTASQLYGLFAVVHSRVSDLRKRGHVITCVRVSGELGAKAYVYTLVHDAEPLGSAETHSDRLTARGGSDGDSALLSGEQLVLA